MIQIHEYTDTNGRSPFADWFNHLDASGAGVFEFRIDSGPGYRIYFGKDGERLVILLAGGTKKRQQRDIEDAQTRWNDYKRRKRQRGDK